MTCRVILQAAERAVTKLAIERGRLKAERVDPDMLDPTPTRFLFGSLHDLRSEPLPTIVVRHPKQTDIKPAKENLSGQSSDDFLSFPQRDRQPAMIERSNGVPIKGEKAIQDFAPCGAVVPVQLEARHRCACQLSATFTELSGNSTPKQR